MKRDNSSNRTKKLVVILFAIVVAVILLNPFAALVGNYLVRDDGAAVLNDVVILAGHFPTRFLEAFEQIKGNKIKRVLFTKNRFPEHYDKIKELGFKVASPYEISRDILLANDFPAENIFFAKGFVKSTRDEAITIGNFMREHQVKKMSIVTSKGSSRRQCWIIEKMNPEFTFKCLPSRYDIFSPALWWKSRRDVMIVFNEYLKLAGYSVEFLFAKKVFQ